MNTPQLRKRLDVSKTAMLTFMHAVSMCEWLFDHRWSQILPWFTQSFDSGIGNAAGDYYVRFDFEFFRKTSLSQKVSVLMHYDYTWGRDADPSFVQAEFYVNDMLVAIRTKVDVLEERPDRIDYVNPEMLEKATTHMLEASLYVQAFEWKSAGMGAQMAKLVVYHRRYLLMLDVPSMHLDHIEKIRAELVELEQVGLCFQVSKEDVPEGFVRFIAQRQHNWNCVWRDFITNMNRLLDVSAVEIE